MATKKLQATLNLGAQNIFPSTISLSAALDATIDGDSATSGALKVTSSDHIAICTQDSDEGDDGDGLDSGSRAFVFVKNVGNNDDGDVEIEDDSNNRIAHLKAGEFAFFPFMHSASANASVKVSADGSTAAYAEYMVIETTITDY